MSYSGCFRCCLLDKDQVGMAFKVFEYIYVPKKPGPDLCALDAPFKQPVCKALEINEILPRCSIYRTLLFTELFQEVQVL